MQVIFDAIINNVPSPHVIPDAPLQMLVTNLEYSDYVGQIAIGRVFAGQITEGQRVTVIDAEGLHTQQKIRRVGQVAGGGNHAIHRSLGALVL